ncbi:FtsX-like permease family protein [Pelagibacteraceae bacterium]|nr:FtsX-like permease family protein [Pelagibacteraceae bacterium]
MLLKLTINSLYARLLTVSMTVLAISLSLMLYLSIEKLRSSSYTSFTNTISQTDLIVGSRTGSVQLLLYSIFRIGNATNNITWESYKDIINRDEVKWSVPISLGDSHKGFRVMGTNVDFFKRYKYRGDQSLKIEKGKYFLDLYDVVIGFGVAEKLGYKISTPLIVSHGLKSFTEHDDQPFKVSGILAKTGTPVDNTIIVSLEAIEAIHVDWSSGAKIPGKVTPIDQIRKMDLSPSNITAVLLGVNSKLKIFQLQRWINEYPEEALSSILPGVALQELWRIVGVVENILLGISSIVVLTTLMGMTAIVFSSLSERRREMAIWRAMGASPKIIIGLLMLEAFIISTLSVVVSTLLLFILLYFIQPWIDSTYGILITIEMLSLKDIYIFILFIFAAMFVSLIPAMRAYWFSINDGMTIKI